MLYIVYTGRVKVEIPSPKGDHRWDGQGQSAAIMSPTSEDITEASIDVTPEEDKEGKENINFQPESMEEVLKQGKEKSDQAFLLFKKGDFEESAGLFSEALDLMVPHVGQLALALGPIYLAYGRALMQIAIANQDALLVTKLPENVPNKARVDEGKTGEEENSGKIIDLPDIIPEESDESEHQDTEKGNEEQEDDFKLAWEILDIARLIYSKQEDPLSRQVLSDIHMDLGDLQMENEQFPSALEDYQRALDLCNDEGVEGKRALASIHFKIAMAQEYSGDLEKAIPPLTAAVDLLKTCPTDSDIEGL